MDALKDARFFSHIRIRESIAATLRNLTDDDSEDLIRLQIGMGSGALAGLVKELNEHNKPTLRIAAAKILRNLAATKDDYMKGRIARENGALAAIVKCLSAQNSFVLPELANLPEIVAEILTNLAATDCKDIKLHIIDAKGVIDGLVKSLTKHDSSRQYSANLQLEAARTLENLAIILKRDMLFNRGVLDGLVKALSDENSTALRTHAARALGCVSRANPKSITRRIVNHSMILGLLEALGENDKPDLQRAAASTLKDLMLMGESQSFIHRIATADHCLALLAGCLSISDHVLGADVMGIVCSLTTKGHRKVISKIVTNRDCLRRLVECCFAPNSPFAEIGVKILANLVKVKDDTVNHKIAKELGVLAGLSKFLSMTQEQPALSKEALAILVDLTDTKDDTIKHQIAYEAGLFRSLIKCLSVTHELLDYYQESASKILMNLASTRDISLKRKIVDEGAVEALTKCWFTLDNPISPEPPVRPLVKPSTNGESSDSSKRRERDIEDGAWASRDDRSASSNEVDSGSYNGSQRRRRDNEYQSSCASANSYDNCNGSERGSYIRSGSYTRSESF